MEGITQRAGKQIVTFLTLSQVLDTQVVRMSMRPDRHLFKLDVEQPDDRVFRYGQHKVLVVDPLTDVRANGAILDYEEESSQFILV